jgi:hypothetical protein
MTVSAQAYDALFDLVLDPTLLDLVLAMPDLSWREAASTVGMLLAWDILTKPLAAFFWRHSRRHLSRGLFSRGIFKLAVVLDPGVGSSRGPLSAGRGATSVAA